MYQINGFEFESKEEAQTAYREAEGIKYIKAQVGMNEPDKVLSLYNRLIQQKVFVTPVGHSFLQELHAYLETIPHIKKEQLMPMPELGAEWANVKPQAAEQAQTQKRPEPEDALEQQRREARVIRKRREKQRQEAEAARQREEGKGSAYYYKKRYQVTLTLSIVLAIAVVSMFLITALAVDNVNIINYRTKIINEYEQWEQNLEEREAALEERETELNK